MFGLISNFESSSGKGRPSYRLIYRRTTLRMVAMVSMGAMRLAVEDWRQAGGKRSLADYLTRYLKQTAVPSLERKATPGAPRRNPALS